MEKKNVKFETRVKIHEFEKYLEDASYDDQEDDYSDGEANDSEYDVNRSQEE